MKGYNSPKSDELEIRLNRFLTIRAKLFTHGSKYYYWLKFPLNYKQ